MTQSYDTDLSTHPYPGIARAALEIAYDNGNINRESTEQDELDELERLLKTWEKNNLQVMDAWLSALSEEDMATVTAGEDTAMNELLKLAPEGTDDLLGEIFEGPEFET